MNHFWQGFEKEAAFGRTKELVNKLKGFFTGKETFYHGTTSRNARNIMKEGLKPASRNGAFGNFGGLGPTGTMHGGAPKTFLTTNPDIAQAYADMPQVRRHAFKNLEGAEGPVSRTLALLKANYAKKVPGRVLEIELPKKELAHYGVERMKNPLNPEKFMRSVVHTEKEVSPSLIKVKGKTK